MILLISAKWLWNDLHLLPQHRMILKWPSYLLAMLQGPCHSYGECGSITWVDFGAGTRAGSLATGWIRCHPGMARITGQRTECASSWAKGPVEKLNHSRYQGFPQGCAYVWDYRQGPRWPQDRKVILEGLASGCLPPSLGCSPWLFMVSGPLPRGLLGPVQTPI